MPSLSPTLEKEIRRLARREIKAQVAPTRQAIAKHRAELAELKRKVREQQRILASLQARKFDKSASSAADEALSEYERWILDRPKVLSGILEGLRQADRGEFVKDPPDFEADMEMARKALGKFDRKKCKG